jgi:RHS repeat-associated protein
VYQYGNNVWPVNTFDTVLRPKETYSTKANNPNYWMLYITNAWNTNGTLGSLSEGYGPQVTWGNMTWYNGSFGYDHLNRLTSAGDTGWSRTFSYDQYANMSVTSNSNVPLNGLTPVNQGTNPYNPANNRLLEANYDAAGNLGTIGALSFWYDAEGRQTQSYDAGSKTTAYYTYDADGQRVQKAVSNGPTTVYIHDAFGNLAAEYASSAPTPPCTTCYLSYDHLGSVRLITDQNANVVSRHDYLPFGEEIPNGSGGRSGNGFGAFSNVNQMFTGQERDGELVPNTDFFNARYFMGVLGNFTQPDPGNAGADPYHPQSWNAYAYVLGNPLNGVDPSGMWWCDPEDPSCEPDWPPPFFPPCFFFDCDGGGGGGGNGGGSGGGGTSSNTPRSTPLPPNSFPGGETLGLPPGMRVPLPSPAVLLGLNLNLNCEFGVCVPGLGPMGVEPSTQIQSLYKNILEHLQKIEQNPYSPDVEHWESEIRTWFNEISKKATKVTLKRRPGALDKYLQRTIGITLEDLEDLLPSPVIIVNPCVINPRMPFCGPVSPGVPPIA